MKRLLVFLLITLLSGYNLSAEQTDTKDSIRTPSVNGKEFLLHYYQQTLDSLQKCVDGLSDAQLQFKAAPDRWSISQRLEPVVLTEKALFDFATKGMNAAANPERRKEIKVTDETIIKGINDRSHKAKADAALTGKGKYSTSADAIAELQDYRKVILDYINSVSLLDLRNHINDSPFGAIDGFQSFLFVAEHTSRHTLQIKEVKADAIFPKQ
ncbi:DinB family protein [Arcticibacter eurypsychrophilus]|uniref:DinB family protein n=1 Tax=Arcticibacter eurypsychrophilus TaxID=1434752 RepID=UPI00084D32F1|nr:DinB family protein [Arcticibacter eurypsychrophilus]